MLSVLPDCGDSSAKRLVDPHRIACIPVSPCITVSLAWWYKVFANKNNAVASVSPVSLKNISRVRIFGGCANFSDFPVRLCGHSIAGNGAKRSSGASYMLPAMNLDRIKNR